MAHEATPSATHGTYNAAHDLLFSNVAAGRGAKDAYREVGGRSTTYQDLAGRVQRFAAGLSALGIRREERILLCLLDTIDFPVAFLGALYAGVVPVAVNTLLTPDDYDFMLKDSRAKALFVSAALWPSVAAILKNHAQLEVVVSGGTVEGTRPFGSLLDGARLEEPAETHADEPAFWLYSSGSTGRPKGTVHAQASLRLTADHYAKPILGITERDVVYSAAKLFFAYGLGNALTFPLSVGATTVLLAERPTPAAVARVLTEYRPTIFCGVPTLFNALLSSPELPGRAAVNLRVCTSAGEALPAQTGRRWTEHFGVDILDGLGSTEMLHIFVSNRPGTVRYGTTGQPVPGYRIRLVDDAGQAVPQGEIGELQVEGPTSALYYWNSRERTQSTFLGSWTRSGDKYLEDEAGYLVYCGRTDDMLKVGGIYVAPFEVEAALGAHERVLEAAVVGHADEAGLIKPKAFVVLKPGFEPSAQLEAELKAFVKERLAPYKYPRWIEFTPDLPKTATGKIQRFKLRV